MGLLEQLATALGDRYRVERELGQGGMAVVFLAEDLKHRRRVAIKLLKPELSAILGSERFLREIEIAAALQHPHILPLYDSGQAGGLLYYVMPFAEGESLRQRLAREQQLPLDAALQITREVGSALQYAHEHGVVHRDIKPENIMLSGGQAVVADFGIARALHAASAEQLTLTGMVVGTPQYMSPEQAGGGGGGRSKRSVQPGVHPVRDADRSAALHRAVIPGRHRPALAGARAQPARRSPDGAAGVEAAIMRAMAKLPADRFASIQEFLAALESPDITSALPGVPARPRAELVTRVGRRVMAAVVAACWSPRRPGGLWQGAPARRAHPGFRARAIAVLPFQDPASNPDSSYLAAGMTEGLIADLAQIGSLKVIAGSSGSMAQGMARSLADIARELGVDAIVKGSIRRAGDSVRVTVRFLHAPDSTLLFTGDYQGRLGELPDLQREITVAITGSIGAELKGAERSRLDVRRAVDQRAYEAYLRGRFYLDRGEVEQARTEFEQASRVAPDWAPPRVGLANYYTVLPFYTDVSPAEVLPKARAALVRALELDNTLAEAHAANAYIRAYYEWDWRAAEQEFRRALELRPNYADAYFSYSRFLASRRRLDEAIAQLGRAVELDPLSLPLLANRALLEYFAGHYGEADRRLREILKSDSTDVTSKWGLALVQEQEGRPGEAIALLKPISGSSLNRKSSLGHAYAVAGRAAEARSVLDTLRAAAGRGYVPSYWFALLHTGLGQRDSALRYLERAYEERSTVLAYLLIDPRLAPLRDDPRFLALARRLGGE